MSAYLGDIAPSQILYFLWESHGADGASITRATNGTISVYKDDGLTQSTAGVTDVEDFDSLTGIHSVKIDTSADGTFYAAGHDYAVVLSAATIDGKSVNSVLGHFSINNRSAIRPSTAGRTLGVDASGNVTLPTAYDPAKTVYAVAGDAMALTGDLTATMKASVTTAATAATPTAAAVTGNIGGNVVGSVASVVGNVGGNVVGSVGSVVATVAANLTQILGSAFTEGAAGRIAAAFKQFFNIASPAATMDHGVLVDTATAVTNRVTANADQIEGVDATDQIRDAVLSDSIRFAGADIATTKGRLPAALTVAGNIKADVQQWLGVTPEALVGNPGLVQTDVEFWLGHAPIAPDVDGLPIVQPLHRYSASVRVVRDEVGTTDRYEVIWLRDGEPFTGTVTTPKIQVVKQSDGSDLIANVTLPASPTGLGYLYEAVGAELQTGGAGYLVYLDATIDGALRQAWIEAGENTSAVDAAIKAKTDLLPSDPASESAVEGAIGGLNNLSTTDVGAALTAYGAAKTSDVPTLDEIGDEVWDETLGDHLAVGSTGEALNGAGSAGDPWATPLPGAYPAGTAGKLVGDNLDVPVGSRAIAGDAMALTSGERTTLTAAIWAASVRSLTTFGTLVTDIWANAARTLTSGVNIVLTKGTGLLGLNDPTADEGADALLDRADAIETGWTLRKVLRLTSSALLGRTTGGHTNTIHFRDLNDTKDRIVATTDLDATGSDRTSVTLDGD